MFWHIPRGSSSEQIRYSLGSGKRPKPAYNTSAYVASLLRTKNQQEWVKFASFSVVRRLKSFKLSASGGFAPRPPDQGSAPGPHWNAKLLDSVLAIFNKYLYLYLYILPKTNSPFKVQDLTLLINFISSKIK